MLRTRTRPSVISSQTSRQITSFTITYDVEPTFDYVTVKSGDGDGRGPASLVIPRTLRQSWCRSTDGKAELVFTSDDKGRRGGFRATYVGKNFVCVSDSDCSDHGNCTDVGL